MLTSCIRWITSTAIIVVLIVASAPVDAQEIDPTLYSQLEFRHIGPQGNRVIAAAGVPGDLNIYYTGAASGGIWKTYDGGINWEPIFDDQEVSSVGSLAIAASDPNIVWAGTGETFLRSNISIGNGIYKSTDAGKTWQHMGLENTGRIGRIVIDPRDPNIVFAAAMGHCYGPQPERGVYRTTDGGTTWEKVLFVDENTGASDIAMDPNNPRILIAGTWQVLIQTWGRFSGGPGSGLHKSTDGGTTWKRLEEHGLPTTEVGKIAVAIAPSDSNRVYALIETGDGVPQEGKDAEDMGNGALWRSDDGGENWKLVNYHHILNERPHYYSRLAVAPDNPNDLYFVAGTLSRSIDGGLTNERVAVWPDKHDMWVDPTDPRRMILATDGGPIITTNRGKNWNMTNLPIAQMYHVAVDDRIPYNVYGNRQDGPSVRGPSNALSTGGGLWGVGIPTGAWKQVGGNESGFAIPDPVDDNIVWSGGFDAALDRFDSRTGHARSVKPWPETYMGWPGGEVKYRFQWTFPIVISPHDHNRVYVGSQFVHQTTDGGESWTLISPDLSTNNPEMLGDSGGLKFDNLGVEYGCTIFALAESPLEEGLLWAGTNDGQVQVTRDGGGSWTNVTDKIPGLPPSGTVSNIEPSRYDAATAYITVDFHQVNNRDPFVYKTTDYGNSWKSISSDIPKSVFSYAHCVREDPVRKGMLYLGTENTLYVSFNDGDNWLPLQNNMPHAPVHWMVVQERFNDLVVATYGRGFWILDDITPLQQWDADAIAADVHLFEPRTAYRFRPVTSPMHVVKDQCIGQEPPFGASLHYTLKSEPEDDVEILVTDQENQTVRKLEGTKEIGINKIMWDLRHEPSREAKIRTNYQYAPHVTIDPATGWRPLPGGGTIRPLAVPGTYTVKLKVGEQELTAELVVTKDPNSTGTVADIQAQTKMALELRDDLNAVVDMIDQIEWIRKQIYDLAAILEGDESAKEIIDAGKELDEKLIGVEENLYQMRRTPQADNYRWKMRLVRRIQNLADDIESSWGDVGHDFAPTTQHREVHQLQKERIATYQQHLDELIATDVAAYNVRLKEASFPTVYVKTE